jgi:NADH-quinone oxidoreductase subunit A
MPEGYLPILVMLIVATGFAGIALGVPTLFGPRRDNQAKNEPYETGMLPLGDVRRRFPVQFYMVAVLYILFDVEVILLYPWAVMLHQLRWFGLAEMAVFLIILLVGFFYAWKNDAFNWL